MNGWAAVFESCKAGELQDTSINAICEELRKVVKGECQEPRFNYRGELIGAVDREEILNDLLKIKRLADVEVNVRGVVQKRRVVKASMWCSECNGEGGASILL